MVDTPTVLMMWMTSCRMKTVRRMEGIVGSLVGALQTSKTALSDLGDRVGGCVVGEEEVGCGLG